MLLECYGHFVSAGLMGGKKHREVVGKNKPKQDRKQQISPFRSSRVLSVFLPSAVALQGHLGPAGGPTQPCLHQSIQRPWRERPQWLPKRGPYPSLPLPQERSGLEGEAQGTEDVFTLITPL